MMILIIMKKVNLKQIKIYSLIYNLKSFNHTYFLIFWIITKNRKFHRKYDISSISDYDWIPFGVHKQSL